MTPRSPVRTASWCTPTDLTGARGHGAGSASSGTICAMSDTNPQSTEARYGRIWRVVAAIPPGQVASYGQVAQLAGIARGARQVGRALGQAPAQMNLPWFRVITANGRIAMAPDSPGFRRQRERLLADGVVVSDGRVDMRRFRWTPGTDEILLGL